MKIKHKSKHSPCRVQHIEQHWRRRFVRMGQLSRQKLYRRNPISKQAHNEIASTGIMLDQRSRDEHILALSDGLRQFKERAELWANCLVGYADGLFWVFDDLLLFWPWYVETGNAPCFGCKSPETHAQFPEEVELWLNRFYFVSGQHEDRSINNSHHIR